VAKNNSSEKASKPLISTADYASFIANLKKKIRSSQFKAALSVNQEMIRLYWDIGKDIVDKQEKDGWGTKVIERVAKDLQNAFPGIEGFSRTNIGRMKAFYLAYSIYPQAVGKLEDLPVFRLPWGHNIALLETLKDINERLWYANMTIAEGWSRKALLDMIKAKQFKRQGKAVNNFDIRLPAPHSKLAQDTLKDPY
jgi:predicted nuclease of restriction endonuclease-like (RecB) superfamily